VSVLWADDGAGGGGSNGHHHRISTAAHWSPAANQWQPSPECGELSLLSKLKNTIFQNKMESL
jgi:hypothetical protein